MTIEQHIQAAKDHIQKAENAVHDTVIIDPISVATAIGTAHAIIALAELFNRINVSGHYTTNRM